MPSSRAMIAATASVLLAPLLVVPLAGSAGAAGGPPTPRPLASSIAVSWQRTAIRTIYTEGLSAPPAGAMYLAFTSLAVHDAAVEAQRHGTQAAAAAVATAAHDVLRQYFPASGAALDADLAASLAMVPDGRKKAAGVDIGASAADDMIASREGDGRNDASRVYAKAPAPGIWQPPPGGAMALPWLGFVTPVIDVDPVTLDGPDPLTSAAYARTTRRCAARRGGRLDPERRTNRSRTILLGQPGPMYRAAVCSLLEAEPMGLLPTTRLFARIDAAVANSFIQTWRLKYEVGFWRPFQAIAGAETDGNRRLTPTRSRGHHWSPIRRTPTTRAATGRRPPHSPR